MIVGVHRIGRLGMLAVGLGIGAAMASTPGVASADTSDGFAAIFGTADIAAAITAPDSAFDPNNLSIALDGINIFTVGTATASAGPFDFAIADGAGASANAAGNGILEIASSEGAGATATAGGSILEFASATGDAAKALAETGTLDFASAFGDDSSALAGGVSANGVDLASAIGDASKAVAGDVANPLGSEDIASAFGDGITATAQTGPFESDFEPAITLLSTDLSPLFEPAITTLSTDLAGDGLFSTALSGGDLLADLLSLL